MAHGDVDRRVESFSGAGRTIRGVGEEPFERGDGSGERPVQRAVEALR